jgi:hypothetical protein
VSNVFIRVTFLLWVIVFFIFNYFLFPCRAGAAVGAAATANAGGIVAAVGAALSAGAGAIASAASSFFGSVSGAGDGAASAAPSGGPRPQNSTGTRPKRKVIFFCFTSAPTLSILCGCWCWLQIMVGICSFIEIISGSSSNDLFSGYVGSWERTMLHAFFSGLAKKLYPVNSYFLVLVWRCGGGWGRGEGLPERADPVPPQRAPSYRSTAFRTYGSACKEDFVIFFLLSFGFMSEIL